MSEPPKRKPGRPPGLRIPILPPADLLHPHTVRLTDAEWDACRDTGDASGLTRKAIQKALRQALTGQAQGKPAERGEYQ